MKSVIISIVYRPTGEKLFDNIIVDPKTITYIQEQLEHKMPVGFPYRKAYESGVPIFKQGSCILPYKILKNCIITEEAE